MSDLDQKEIGRLRNLLAKIAELAEHVEQTGSFESGVQQLVRRYNAIVERLEEMEAVPDALFPKLGDRADAGQLGIETSLLADYLNDFVGEASDPHARHNPPRPVPDVGSLVALAPFLGAGELSKLVRERFSGVASEPAKEETASPAPTSPDINTILALAPHLKSADVEDMARAYLARQGQMDPKQFAALAPFMDGEALGRLMRTYMPEWFGGAAAERTPQPPPVEEEREPERSVGTSLQAQPGKGTWEEAPAPSYAAPRLER